MGANDTTRRQEIDRLVLTAFGGLGGLCAWFLLDVLQDVGPPQRFVLFLTVFAGGFIGAGLAMAMHMPMRRVLALSVLVALPGAALMFWASFRFAQVDEFLRSGHVLVAMFALLALPVPFAMAREQGGDPKSYAALFLNSWNIVVRFAAALLFTGIVWIVLFVSDTLFQLVGIDIIERLVESAALAWMISGMALGLGMAVVDEMEDYVSPYLVLRLMRLLVPAVLIVVVVFIGALPFRGLSALFGDFSAAGTLVGVAIAVVALISIAVDASDGEMAGGAFMARVTQALALCLPVLAGPGRLRDLAAGCAIWLDACAGVGGCDGVGDAGLRGGLRRLRAARGGLGRAHPARQHRDGRRAVGIGRTLAQPGAERRRHFRALADGAVRGG